MVDLNQKPKNRKKVLLTLPVMVLGILLIGVGAYSVGSELDDEAHLFMISHTEYRSAEQGQIIGKLFNFQGDPIIVDSCDVTIYNPDKSVFLGDVPTDNTLEAVDGTHYINFTTPTTEGTYEYKIVCTYPVGAGNDSRTVSNSFHLNPALNTITTVNMTSNEILQILQNASIDGINFVDEFGQIQINLSDITNILNQQNIDLFSDIDAFNNFSQIQQNFSQVQNRIDDVSQNLTDIINFCDGAPTLDSQLCQWVSQNNQLNLNINDTLHNVIDVKLDAINLTTSNTFEFLTVNITNNLNGIQTDISTLLDFASDINNTVNSIQLNTTAIIANQENEVSIMVFS